MNPSAIPSASMLGWLLRTPLRLVPKHWQMFVMQGPIRGYRWVVGSANHGCWLGSYEAEKQAIFCRLVKRGAVVFDVGANVGFYTLLAAEMVGHSGTVCAF